MEKSEQGSGRGLVYDLLTVIADHEAKKERRTRPRPFVDLALYEGMSDEEVAADLGAAPHVISNYSAWIAAERAGTIDSALSERGLARCEAGRKSRLYLRCPNPCPPNRRFCRRCSPEPRQGNPWLAALSTAA